jgi:oligopeptide/dipeptide ABC transporter ATP-binding protein
LAETIFQAKDIVIKFKLRDRVLTAIRGASFDLKKGETLALVGESGSGKSVFTKSFIGMLDKNGWIESGELLYGGMDLATFKQEKEWLKIRGKRIVMVFQDPMTSLNPLKTIGEQIREAIAWHHGKESFKADKQAFRSEAMKILNQVGISETRYFQYPHEFSGGMRQRVVIAAAIACKPEILVCDEPTTALDVTIQAQILQLIQKLQKELGMTVIYITHDLGVVAAVADRVAVMYAGQIVEYGDLEEIFKSPRHPYTKALLQSLPQLGVKGQPLKSIQGTPPNLYHDITGDAFAPRNPDAMRIDAMHEPPMFKVSETHYAKTWTLHEKAAGRLSKSCETQPSAKTLSAPTNEVLLSVKNLSVCYKLGRKRMFAVSDVSFDIMKGETFSLVGESGSGKTTIGRAIMKIVPTHSGEILFQGKSVNRRMSGAELRQFRQQAQMIFQDPIASLNERAKVDYIVSEGLSSLHLCNSEAERQSRVKKAMEEVGLHYEFVSRFPHEFSGGQRQRIGIARSLVMDPGFVIADEPISSLDVSIRAQIINLLNDLKRDRGLTYLFIAHDLSVVKFISDRVAVIYQGKIVELANSDDLFKNPLHPYTKSLLSAVPNPDPDVARLKSFEKYDPSMHAYATDKPSWSKVAEGHFVWANEQELEGYKRLV